MNKLNCYGFEVSAAAAWIISYLTNTKYTVHFSGSYSGITVVTCGVPQGSCLVPFLFSIYTKDLHPILNYVTTAKYTDDSII